MRFGRRKAGDHEHPVQEALDAQAVSRQKFSMTGMIKAMDAVGENLKTEKFCAGNASGSRAMKKVLRISPNLILLQVQQAHRKVIIGTVAGDLHDIVKIW